MTLRDAQEQVEAPNITFKERNPLKKFMNFMELMHNVIEEATYQHV
jgi:hypothetical protein